MKIQDLVYYRYLADCSSFTKTAEAFFVSQPSISIALKRLEEEFETQLITRDRSTKSFALTPTGKILYERADQILTILDQAKHEIKSNEENVIHFGFLPTIAGYFLPRLMPNMAEFVQSIQLVEDESSKHMLQLLEDGIVSAAITGLPDHDLEGDWAEIYPIDTRPLSICVPKSHPLANNREVTLNQIRNYSLVTLDEKYVHHQIVSNWMGKVGIQTSQVTFAKEIQSVHSLIASSLSVGLIHDVLVHDRPDLVTIPLKEGPEFTTALVINKNLKLTEAQAAFNQSLREKVLQLKQV